MLQSRADGLGLTVEVGDEANFNVDKDVSGVLVQYPATDGTVHDYKVCCTNQHLLIVIMELFVSFALIILSTMQLLWYWVAAFLNACMR